MYRKGQDVHNKGLIGHVPGDHFSWQENFLGFSSLTYNIIVAGNAVVELPKEGLLDSGALLVDGVARRVGHVVDAFTYIRTVVAPRNHFIQVEKLVTIVRQIREHDTFRMSQEEHV